MDDTRPGHLRFVAVSKRYPPSPGSSRPTAAVVDLDLTVEPGDAVGIIGPNGAGKSTVLALAAGISAPSAGHIERVGRTRAVIELGAGLHPDLTGRENIRLLAGLYGLDQRWISHRFDDVVGFAGLGDAVDRRVRHYSTGMVARLSVSVALWSEPEILLVDEVLSVGDATFQRECRTRIRRLQEGGTTFVLVSHDLELVGELCRTGVLLDDGRAVLVGTAEDAIRRHLGLATAERGDPRLELSVGHATVEAGEPITARCTVPASSRSLLVEMLVPDHPVLVAHGQSGALAFASTRVPATAAGPTEIVVHTRGLPPGAYELQVTTEGSDDATGLTQAVPVRIAGPGGPFALRLDARARVRALSASDGAP